MSQMKKAISYQNQGSVQTVQRPIYCGSNRKEYAFDFNASILHSYTYKRPWFYKDLC